MNTASELIFVWDKEAQRIDEALRLTESRTGLPRDLDVYLRFLDDVAHPNASGARSFTPIDKPFVLL